MDISQRIAERAQWYHRIELAPGVWTPGHDDSPGKLAIFDALGLPTDAHGLRVLDVGTADGFFAFEMERRGADVTAIDIRPPDQNGFALAKEILGSRVEYQQRCVYDIKPDTDGQFDIILFLGVLYHLRHPLLGLDRMRQAVRSGGLMFIDTHSIEPGFYTDKLQPIPATEHVAPSGVALWQTFTEHCSPYVGFSPNTEALREALYKTQWIMGDKWRLVSSRLYATAQPYSNPNVEAQICMEGLR